MRSIMFLGAVLALSYSVQAQSQPAPASASPAMAKPAASSQLPRPEPYLGKDRLPSSIAILPPPPVKESIEDRFDNETYKETRTLAGTPRYALATRDAAQYVQEFECPLGAPVSAWPKSVIVLLSRVARDSSTLTNTAKDHWGHPRPFLTNNGSMCTESDRDGLTKSPSYPSGHATYSWSMALILAEMVPERATEILARSRAFGESRVVCGVHTVSDITEGRTNGSALVAVLHSDAAFQADLAVAKAELRAALAAPHPTPDAAQCKVEADAELHTPWINPTAGK